MGVKCFNCKILAIIILLFFNSVFAEGIKGLYVAIPAADPLPTPEEWQTPFISGFFVRPKWRILEPSRDTYDWSRLDTVVADAATYNKKVFITLKVGLRVNGITENDSTGLPDWYTGATFSCDNGDVGPIHFDPEYQREYRQIVRDMILRYDSNPVVVGYALSGWQSWAFIEMSPPCRNTNTANDRAGIIAAGYTRQKIADYAVTVIRDVRQLTKKPIRIGMGRLIDETTQQNSVTDFIPYIADNVEFFRSPRFAVQRSLPSILIPTFDFARRVVVEARVHNMLFGKTNLRASPTENTSDPLKIWNTQPLNSEELMVYKYRGQNFWQTEIAGGGGPITVEEWYQAGDVGLHYGMQFLEIRRQDIVRPELAEVLTCLQQAMLEGDRHCGH